MGDCRSDWVSLDASGWLGWLNVRYSCRLQPHSGAGGGVIDNLVVVVVVERRET